MSVEAVAAGPEAEVVPASVERMPAAVMPGAVPLSGGVSGAQLLALQRRAGNRAACALVQRAAAPAQMLQRYRFKPKLESEDLDDPRLQEAVSSADRALNV